MPSKPLTQSDRPVSAAPKPMSGLERLKPIAGAVLRGAARGLAGGFQAGELWLLDNESKSLRLAVRWTERKCAPPTRRRLLANAPADVAALAGGAVVLEDHAETMGWDLHAPEAAAAVCLPVSSDTTIHGVMWLLGDTPRVITDEAVELAEVVAGRLALEVENKLEGETWADEIHNPTPPSRPSEKAPMAAKPAAGPTPVFSPSPCLAPVETAAWAAPHAEGLSAARCWELSDRRLLALATASIDSPESTAATQRTAVEWLMAEAAEIAEKAADAGILLTLLNRRLQNSSLAGEGLAATAALVDPPEDETAGLGGSGTWAFAGPTIALSVRAAATESHAGDLVPLGWTEPESSYAPRPFELAVRQRLILTAGDPRLTSPLAERRLGDAYRAATADAHREMSAEACLRRLVGTGSDDLLAAVALRRS